MIQVPFDAANYAASGSGTWTVRPQDQINLEYAIDHDRRIVFVNWVIGNTNVSGSPVGLRMRVPGVPVPARRVEPLHYFTDGNENKQVGWCDINPAACSPDNVWIVSYKLDLSPWQTTAAHNTAIHGQAYYSF